MTVGILTLLISYLILLLMLTWGWLKSIASKSNHLFSTHKFISIIVPVRNEEEKIDAVLKDLLSQTYPKDRYEIIVVDDHSEDNTRRVVYEISTGLMRMKIILNEGIGKKAAITSGINAAHGEIIITTDADCRMGSNWILSLSNKFDEKTMMVFGAVKIRSEKSQFSKVQAMEFSSLIGSGAATLAWGMPTMCNGANLAFRKETFKEVGGYQNNTHVASGDDEFLMRKIARKYPAGICFDASQESIVTTAPQPTLSGFVGQRLRWAGKWNFHSDFKSKLLAVYILLLHLAVLSLPVFVLLGYLSFTFAGLFFFGRALLEYSFLKLITSWLKVKWNWSAFIILQLTYSFYVVVVGFASNFVKPFWKGRK